MGHINFQFIIFNIQFSRDVFEVVNYFGEGREWELESMDLEQEILGRSIFMVVYCV